MVDTNSDPRDVDFVIPSNDDASKSIDKILGLVTGALAEGLQERKNEKEEDAKNMEAAAKKTEAAEAAVEVAPSVEKAPAVKSSEEKKEEKTNS